LLVGDRAGIHAHGLCHALLCLDKKVGMTLQKDDQ
jgi:hypothetical protein